MKSLKLLLAASALAFSAGAPAVAGGDTLSIDGLEMTIRAPAPAHVENLKEVMSGWLFRSAETRLAAFTLRS